MTKIIIALFLLAPLSLFAQTNNPAPQKEGTASFYGNQFEGQKTSNGETFSQKALTAASNFFKLNTFVRVTNLLNNESVVVKITDRMHPRMAQKGRVVDLSLTAAKEIKMISQGIAKVIVELMPSGSILD